MLHDIIIEDALEENEILLLLSNLREQSEDPKVFNYLCIYQAPLKKVLLPLVEQYKTVTIQEQDISINAECWELKNAILYWKDLVSKFKEQPYQCNSEELKKIIKELNKDNPDFFIIEDLVYHLYTSYL